MQKLFLISIFLIYSFINYGQVSIGSANPDSSAILHLDASSLPANGKKGFLGPKVSLTSNTDQTTIPSPAEGLIVYNDGAGGLNYKGYVYWVNSEWKSFTNSNLNNGLIGSISCNGISMNPGTYTNGVNYSGTLTIPYSNGNGGNYAAQTIGPINGLTATLSSGNFAIGSGSLVYEVKGTPTVSSPTSTTFGLTIGGQTCNAIVGKGAQMKIGELSYFKASIPASTSSVWLSDSIPNLPILGGKLRLDAYFNASSNAGNSNVSILPRLVNVSGSPIKIWFSSQSTVDNFNAGNYLLESSPATGTPTAYVDLDNGLYYGYGYNDISGTSIPRTSGSGQGGHQEVLVVDVVLEGNWYKVYYFPIVDNKNTATDTDNTREIYLSFQRIY